MRHPSTTSYALRDGRSHGQGGYWVSVLLAMTIAGCSSIHNGSNADWNKVKDKYKPRKEFMIPNTSRNRNLGYNQIDPDIYCGWYC